MNNDSTQQIPPRGDNGKNEVGALLAAASNFARSVLGSIQALAWTAYCKGVQIARLKDFIDTIIFKTGTGGYDTYHSLSPRASK